MGTSRKKRPKKKGKSGRRTTPFPFEFRLKVCPNRQLMAQRNRENGVTLPSVKTNYTERSETHENEKEETFNQGEERFPDVGLPG
jgi:hypothetical protein